MSLQPYATVMKDKTKKKKEKQLNAKMRRNAKDTKE